MGDIFSWISAFRLHELLTLVGAVFLCYGFGFQLRMHPAEIIWTGWKPVALLLACSLLGLGAWQRQQNRTDKDEEVTNRAININNYFQVDQTMPIPFTTRLEEMDPQIRAALIRQVIRKATDAAQVRYQQCCNLGMQELAALHPNRNDYLMIKSEKIDFDRITCKATYTVSAVYLRTPFYLPDLRGQRPVLDKSGPGQPIPIDSIALPEGWQFAAAGAMTFEEAQYRLTSSHRARIAQLALWILENYHHRHITHVCCEGFASRKAVQPPGIPYAGAGYAGAQDEEMPFSGNTGKSLGPVLADNYQLSYARAFEGISHLVKELTALDPSQTILKNIRFYYRGNGVFPETGDGKRISFSYQ